MVEATRKYTCTHTSERTKTVQLALKVRSQNAFKPNLLSGILFVRTVLRNCGLLDECDA